MKIGDLVRFVNDAWGDPRTAPGPIGIVTRIGAAREGIGGELFATVFFWDADFHSPYTSPIDDFEVVNEKLMGVAE